MKTIEQINKILNDLHHIYYDKEDPQYWEKKVYYTPIYYQNTIIILGDCKGLMYENGNIHILTEDDGNWFKSDYQPESFSIAWLPDMIVVFSIMNIAIQKLYKPICYKDTNHVCFNSIDEEKLKVFCNTFKL